MAAFLLALLSFGLFISQIARADSRDLILKEIILNDVVQDESGWVWGIATNKIVIWKNDQWEQGPCPNQSANWRPIKLGINQSGYVVCLWNCASNSYALTQHTLSNSVAFSAFTGILPENPRLFFDNADNIWITGEGAAIYRVGLAPRDIQTYFLTQPLLCEGNKSIIVKNRYQYVGNITNIVTTTNIISQYNPVYVFQDSIDRLWFWSCGDSFKDSIRGVLMYENSMFAHYPSLCERNKSYNRLDLISEKDANTLWVAGHKDNQDYLCEIDIRNLRAKKTELPAKRVLDITLHNNDWYVLVDDCQSRNGEVWKQRDTQWSRIIKKYGNGTYNAPRSRYRLSTKDGLWLGACKNGAWYVANTDEVPICINWQHRFPLPDVDDIFQLNDQQLLFVDRDYGAVLTTPSFLLPTMPSNKVVPLLEEDAPLIQDRKKHIWGLSAKDNVLKEWTGNEWINHNLPNGFPTPYAYNLGIDTLQRIWLIGLFDRPCALFNPNLNFWRVYSNTYSAAESEANICSTEKEQVSFRLCFHFNPELHYYDGKEWRHWYISSIDCKFPHIVGCYNCQPYFDESNQLGVNIGTNTWALVGTNKWVVKSSASKVADKELFQRYRELFPLTMIDKPGLSIRDDSGNYWATAGRQLYKAIGAIYIPQFDSDIAHPFLDGRAVVESLTDPNGNVFLKTAPCDGHARYVMLNSPKPLPMTTVKSKQVGSDSLRLTFSSAATGTYWYVWRLNKSSWSHPLTNKTFVLAGLEYGKHPVEFAVLDRSARFDIPIQKFDITLRPTIWRQLSQWLWPFRNKSAEITTRPEQKHLLIEGLSSTTLIKRLRASDYTTREEAAKELARRGQEMLPSLKAALEKASEDQRWWLNAVIQRIENKANLPANQSE